MVATAGGVGGFKPQAVFEETAGIEHSMVFVEVIGGGKVVEVWEKVRAERFGWR